MKQIVVLALQALTLITCASIKTQKQPLWVGDLLAGEKLSTYLNDHSYHYRSVAIDCTEAFKQVESMIQKQSKSLNLPIVTEIIFQSEKLCAVQVSIDQTVVNQIEKYNQQLSEYSNLKASIETAGQKNWQLHKQAQSYQEELLALEDKKRNLSQAISQQDTLLRDMKNDTDWIKNNKRLHDKLSLEMQSVRDSNRLIDNLDSIIERNIDSLRCSTPLSTINKLFGLGRPDREIRTRISLLYAGKYILVFHNGTQKYMGYCQDLYCLIKPDIEQLPTSFIKCK